MPRCSPLLPLVATSIAALVLSACGSSTKGSATVDSAPGSSLPGTNAPPATLTGNEVGTLQVRIRADSDGSTEEALDSASSSIRQRLDSFGIADASVAIDGDVIEVEILDVAAKDQDAIVELLQPSSRVSLRPVLQCAAAPSTDAGVTTIAVATDTDVLYTRPGPNAEVCQVGPAGGTAAVFSDASAQILSGSWGVLATLRPDETGEGVWNAIAESCYEATELCPSRRLAIELDGVIVSAPTVNAPSFTGSVQISGNFTKVEAEELAAAIAGGTTDVEFVVDSVTFVPNS